MGRAAVWAAGGQRYGAMAGCAVVPAGAGGWPGLEQVLQLQRCRGWLRGLISTHSCIALRTSLPRARAGVAASSAGSAASSATADLQDSSGNREWSQIKNSVLLLKACPAYQAIRHQKHAPPAADGLLGLLCCCAHDNGGPRRPGGDDGGSRAGLQGGSCCQLHGVGATDKWEKRALEVGGRKKRVGVSELWAECYGRACRLQGSTDCLFSRVCGSKLRKHVIFSRG